MVSSIGLGSSHLWGRSHYQPPLMTQPSGAAARGPHAYPKRQLGAACPLPWLAGLVLRPCLGFEDPAGTPSRPWPGGQHLRSQGH